MSNWVTRKIMEIERGNGGDYVLMSNILASAGMHGDAERFRRLMDTRSALKIPGQSLVWNLLIIQMNMMICVVWGTCICLAVLLGPRLLAFTDCDGLNWESCVRSYPWAQIACFCRLLWYELIIDFLKCPIPHRVGRLRRWRDLYTIHTTSVFFTSSQHFSTLFRH